MTNNFAVGDYMVDVMAKKNYVNGWSTNSLENACLSISLFKKENPDKNRTFAKIRKILSVPTRNNKKFQLEEIETINL